MKPNFTIAKIDTKDAVKSVLKIFQVPFNSDMSDSMIFKTKSAQETWMTDQYLKSQDTGGGHLNCAFTFTQFRPFRIGEPFRVKIKWADANRCSYFSYYDAESDKTFYGFITGCYWINRNLTQITYTIDPIQTYMFETIIDGSDSTGKVTIPSCLVERETVNSDKYFQNILSEDITPRTNRVTYAGNLFYLLNNYSYECEYYLIIAKYYLFCEDLGNVEAKEVAKRAYPVNTLASGVKMWLNPNYYGDVPPGIDSYGYNDQTFYYYIIKRDDLSKTLGLIQVLQAGRTTWYAEYLKAWSIVQGASTSSIDNILSITPLPVNCVKRRTTYPESRYSNKELQSLNADVYHVTDGTTDDNRFISTTAVENLKTCLKDIWESQWYKQYELVSPTTDLMPDALQIPTNYTAKNKKSYCEETISVKITSMQQDVDVPIHKLKTSTSSGIYIKLYTYLTLTDSLTLTFSSTPIDNWSAGGTTANYSYLNTSVTIPGIQVFNNNTTAWNQAKKDNAMMCLTSMLSLVPTLGTFGIMNVGRANNIDYRKMAELTRYSEIMNSIHKNAFGKETINIDGTTVNLDENSKTLVQGINAIKGREIDRTLKGLQANVDKEKTIATIEDRLKNANVYKAYGVSFAASMVSQFVNITQSIANNQNTALKTAGKVLSSTINSVPYNLHWPIVMIIEPTDEAFKQIDNYFNWFGYAVNEYKQPSLFNRKCWDYIKTNYMKCDAWAMCPNDAKLAIEQIFNNGIRLHHGKFYEDLTIKNDIAT